MPRTRQIQNSFTAGEVSPDLYYRGDFAKHRSALRDAKNVIIKPQGGCFRRPGMHFVTTSQASGYAPRLHRFVFSNSQSYVLELGHAYIRFYRNEALLVNAGFPVQVTTPYTSGQLQDLHFEQDGDLLYIAHASHPLKVLKRLSDTSWVLEDVIFAPPPTEEAGDKFGGTVTLGATSGNGVSMTTSLNVMVAAHVGRTVRFGNGRAVVRTVTSLTTGTVDITQPFSTTVLDSTWVLEGSPVADLTFAKLDLPNPVGAAVTMNLSKFNESATNLVTDGTFPNLSNWTNNSAPQITTGTATSGSAKVISGQDFYFLVDTTKDFTTFGIVAGDLITNTTTGAWGYVFDILTTTNVNDTVKIRDWTGGAPAAGNGYAVQQTGGAQAVANTALLTGGNHGYGWISQNVTLVTGSRYRLRFDVKDQPLSMMIGSSNGTSNELAEASFEVGNDHIVDFTATTASLWLQFRNNQNVGAKVANVRLQLIDVNGWTSSDVGRYVRVNDGIVKITATTSGVIAVGVIQKALTSVDLATAGTWTRQEEVWTAAKGYPRTLTFFGQRLILGDTNSFPRRLWASHVGIFTDFGTGTDDADAIEMQVKSQEINTVQWLASTKELHVGTHREEHRITGSLGGTLTPNSVQVSTPTRYGSANHQPVRLGRRMIFLTRGKRRIYELTPDVSDVPANAAIDNDLTLLAEHLFDTTTIKRFDFQLLPQPVLWVVTENGKLNALTAYRDQDIVAWAPVVTTGTVHDVTVIPHPDGNRDQAWVVASRNGGQTYTIEFLDDHSGFYGPMLVDSGLIYTGAATTTLTGLGHLNGQTVAILGNGFRFANQTVVNGELVLAAPVTQAEVGLAFTSTVTTLPPSLENGAMAGLKIAQAGVRVGVRSSGVFHVQGREVEFRKGSDLQDTPVPLATQLVKPDVPGWDEEGVVSITQQYPFPLAITTIIRTLEIEEP